jgi:hypothetical protein
MWLALGTGGVVLVVLLWELARPTVMRAVSSARDAWTARGQVREEGYDPGRERRAEQRARELLRSCVSEEEWEMYRDLGVLRVFGPARGETVSPVSNGRPSSGPSPSGEPEPSAVALAPYAYLIYPHKPIVAYVPATGELLSEYCVAFPDETRPYGSPRLPDSDDVLAKWMALTGDERRLIGEANMHLPGRQVDPERVRKDLARIARWESERAAGRGGDGVERPATRRLDNVRAA